MSSATQTSLQPISRHDIDDLASIADRAFTDDRHTQFKSTIGYKHGESTRELLLSMLDRPPSSTRMVKAVDMATSTTTGWAIFGNRGVDFSSSNPSLFVPEQQEPTVSSPTSQPSQDGDDTTSSNKQKPIEFSDSGKEVLAQLSSFTGQDLNSWMDRLMPPGTRCIFLISIVVDPAYQGRGVGGTLLQHGLNIADQEAVFCWVHASEHGSLLFARHGFVEVGRLELDLDSWATQARLEHTSPAWGQYVFRYMKRNMHSR